MTVDLAVLQQLQPRDTGQDTRLYGVAVWRFGQQDGEDWYEAIVQPDFRVFRIILPANPQATDARPARFTVYLAATATAHTAGPPIPWEHLPAGVRQLIEEFAVYPYQDFIRNPKFAANIHLSVKRELERWNYTV